MQSLVPIEELYENVKGFTHVITPDKHLNSLLNARAEGMDGTFAMTPWEMVLRYRMHELEEAPLSEGAFIIRMAHRHELPLPRAHQMITRLLEQWKRAGALPRGSNDQMERALLPDMRKTALPHHLFHSPLQIEGEVAVIAAHFLSTLEAHALPTGHTRIAHMGDKAIDGGSWYRFESESELVNAVISLCSGRKANELAIVIHPDSPLRPLIISRLQERGIAVAADEYASMDTRLFLNVAEMKLRYRSMKVGDISAVVSQFGYAVERKYLNHRITHYLEHDDTLSRFFEKLKKCTTFNELLRMFSHLKGEHPQIQDILEKTGYGDVTISEQANLDMQHYIHAMRPTRAHTGVRISDPTTDRWIDRGFCVYVGMDASWTRIERDEDARTESFSVLIQQGNSRMYLVTSHRGGEEVLPSPYFNVLLTRAVHSFADIAEALGTSLSHISGSTPLHEADFEAKQEGEGRITDHFSQSKLSAFYLCPKKYSYDTLVPDIDQVTLKKGTLLHDFAAFYTARPDVVKEKGAGYFAERMVEECARIIDEEEYASYRTMFHIGIHNIMTFIDSLTLEDVKIPSAKQQENIFAQMLGIEAHHTNTEVMFEDDELGLRGIIDLIINPTRIIDYKTSASPKRGFLIMRESLPQLIQDQADFQAISYLAELRRHSPGQELVFDYYYLLADQKDHIHGAPAESRRRVTVTYKPVSFDELITSDEGFRLLGATQKTERFIALVGKETLRGFLRSYPVPEAYRFAPERLAQSPYANQFVQFVRESLSFPLSTLQNDCIGFIKQVANVRTGKQGAFFFKEDIDAFEKLLTSVHKKNRNYAMTRYPYQPLRRDICKHCDYKDMCLKRFEDGIR